MSLLDIVSLITGLVTIFALAAGAFAGLFIFFQLAPVLSLRITPAWTDETRQFLLVRYEVENKSRVRVHRPAGRVQIFEHALKQGGSLPNFIPFSHADYESTDYGKSMSEHRPGWHEPVPIFTTTRQIYPGESIIVERLYSCAKPDVAVHLGLQVEMSLGLWGRLITRKWEPWRQTTTCILVGHGSSQKLTADKSSGREKLRRS